MLKVNLEPKSENVEAISLIELFHRFAEHNLSVERIDLRIEGRHVYCESEYTNSSYTKGYYALLYAIDCLDLNIAYTCPLNISEASWFNVFVKDEEKLREYLLG